MIDVGQTIIGQYKNSPRLVGIIESMDSAVDPRIDDTKFSTLIWDLDTAVGWGLDFWGKIVGVGRIVQVSAGDFFGFDQGDGQPFNQAPFYAGVPNTNNFPLSDDAYRILIYAKALANITDCSIPSLNRILLTLFPDRGNCYVVDGLNMTMVYKFEFELSPVETAIITQTGVLPRPTGIIQTFDLV